MANELKQNMQDPALQQEVKQDASKKVNPLSIIVLIFITLLLLLVGGIVGYLYSQSKIEDNHKDSNVATQDPETTVTYTATTTTTAKTTTTKTAEKDPYEGWKTVKLEKLGYKIKVPKDWNITEGRNGIEGNYINWAKIDMGQNRFFDISSLCQLGDCGICEIEGKKKTLFKAQILGKETNIDVINCNRHVTDEIYSRSIRFSIENIKIGQNNTLGGGIIIEDITSSITDLKNEFQDLKKALESLSAL